MAGEKLPNHSQQQPQYMYTAIICLIPPSGQYEAHLEGGPSPLGLGVKLKVSSQLRPTMLNHTEKVIYKMVLCVGSSVSPILGKPSSTATPR